VCIPHASVSRQHARIEVGSSWHVQDLGSKNGLRVEGARVDAALLERRSWLAVGDVFCEFEVFDTAGADRVRLREQQRRHSSAAWQDRLAIARGIDELLAQTLQGMMELAECRRGFLLLGDGSGPLRLSQANALDPAEIEGASFSGSRSAVERAMRERRPVFLSGARDRPWLKGAPSVVALGIRALACVPLLHHERLLGAVYVDTDEDAKVFTDFDVELLQAFAERAATALTLGGIEGELRHLEKQHAFAAPPTRGAGQ
jgi:transcriptional regulator with GAF, ATPase, and Fis domain